MEVLLSALIGIIVPLSVGIVAFSINALLLIADIIAIIFSILLFLFKSHTSKTHTSPSEDTKSLTEAHLSEISNMAAGQRKRTRKILVWIFSVVCAILALSIATAAVANRYYFADIVRWSLDGVTKQTGISIDFPNASGSVWTGEIHLAEVEIKRPSHQHSVFDLTVKSAIIDLSMTDLIFLKPVVESVSVKGVRGEWKQLSRATDYQPRREFRINNLELDDLSITYENTTVPVQPIRETLVIDSMRSVKLRSHWLFFDLLFNSNLTGSFAQTGFEITTRYTGGTPFHTIWRCDNFPLPILAVFLGSPFTWFESGRIDVNVDNMAVLEPEPAFVMKWSLVLRNFRAAAPKDASLKVKAAAAPLIKFLNSRAINIPLSFQLQIKKNDNRFSMGGEFENTARLVLGEKAMDALKEFWKKHFTRNQDQTELEKDNSDMVDIEEETGGS